MSNKVGTSMWVDPAKTDLSFIAVIEIASWGDLTVLYIQKDMIHVLLVFSRSNKDKND